MKHLRAKSSPWSEATTTTGKRQKAYCFLATPETPQADLHQANLRSEFIISQETLPWLDSDPNLQVSCKVQSFKELFALIQKLAKQNTLVERQRECLDTYFED